MSVLELNEVHFFKCQKKIIITSERISISVIFKGTSELMS